MSYTNSSLATYKLLSPNHSGQRTHTIDTITIHCVVGQLTAAGICQCFTSSSVEASCNYGVGKDGSIGLCVEEKNRSWCTSSRENDQRAVTIETASDMTSPYAVTDAAYNALIKLVTDICKRNGIKKLVWSTDKNQRMNHLNGCNMTVHRDYAAKECPGDFLYGRMGDIAEKVNKNLGVTSSTPSTPSQPQTKEKMYRIRKSWSNEASQIGAYTSLANAKKECDKHPGYKVYDENGKQVYPEKSSSTKTKMYRVRKTWKDEKSQVGAYENLNNAKKECDKHPGYSVFDDSGKKVYTSKKKEKTYVVKKGDTLSDIAKNIFGTTYQELAKYNNIEDPNNIEIGQTLKYPEE